MKQELLRSTTLFWEWRVGGGKKPLPYAGQISGRCLCMYPSKNFMVLALTLRYLIVFELIFTCGGRLGLKFIPLQVDGRLS